MATADDVTTDEVLGDPGEHTVEDVLAAFADATPEQIEAAKELEAAGKGRKTIAEYAPPRAPEPQEHPEAEEPRFSRERILSEEGPGITGRSMSEIAGALHDSPGEDFTRSEVDKLVQRFYDRDLTSQEA